MANAIRAKPNKHEKGQIYTVNQVIEYRRSSGQGERAAFENLHLVSSNFKIHKIIFIKPLKPLYQKKLERLCHGAYL